MERIEFPKRPDSPGAERWILTLNAGSSSLKSGLFKLGNDPLARCFVTVSEIGDNARITLHSVERKTLIVDTRRSMTGHGEALRYSLELLREHCSVDDVSVVGHRVVFGGAKFNGPTLLDERVTRELESYVPFAPLHQPHNLNGVRAALSAFPNARQVACFDTAFHRTQSWEQEAFALPEEWFDRGVRRFGFHGLSYEFIAGVLQERYPKLAAGKVVVAHLGNGASMCALVNGKSVASTMSFTALDGLPMGTRCGSLDPGVVLYWIGQLGMSVEEVGELLYRRSGLLGLSGQSSDMRVLLKSASKSCERAVSYFVSRVQRELGSLVAVMGGFDALVFTAGIGENSPEVRERVCAGLEWFGVRLAHEANFGGDEQISSFESPVTVLTLPTNEELVIARAANRLIEPV